MYTDITEYSLFDFNNSSIIIDFYIKNEINTFEVETDYKLSLDSNNNFYNFLVLKIQNDNNKIVAGLAGIFVASASISWYNAEGGLTYYGVSGLASAAVGAVIWIGLAGLVGYGVYLILDEILDWGD